MIPYVIQPDSRGRPTRQSLHMQMAFMWAERSLDPRRKVGAVITTSDLREVISFGYNGPAKGLPPEYIRSTPGDSGCLHAEDNAIARMNSTVSGKVIFVTDQPCEMCAQRIVNAGIGKLFYVKDYRDKMGLTILHQCRVEVVQMPLTGALVMVNNPGVITAVQRLGARSSLLTLKQQDLLRSQEIGSLHSPT